MVEFTFTEAQQARVLAEAARRQEFNEKKNFKGRNQAPSKGEAAKQMHLLGTAAELAVACYLNAEQFLFLEEGPVRGSCDIPGIDIKCRSGHNRDLLVQLDDNLNKIYVLVTIENKKTYLHGYIFGVEVPTIGEVKEFIPGRPCYVVPQSRLMPIEKLKKYYNPEIAAREPIETIRERL